MDKHVMHNIIHQDSGSNSEKCPVCNGSMKMDDQDAMMGETNKILQKRQLQNGPFAYSSNKYTGRDDVDKAKLHTFAEVLEFADSGELPKKIQILKSGVYDTQKYGKVTITKADLEEMVKNFHDGVRAGSALPIDTDHDRGAANGWIKELSVDSKGILWGETEWNDLGKAKLESKQYGFISAEFDQYYVDPEHSIELNNVLIAASLVNRPMIKELQPLVKFSESEAENAVDDKKLTDDKKDVMIFIDLENKTSDQKNHMDIKTIIAKAKADRSSDEAKYLSDHQEELTPEQKTAEGFTAAAEEKKGEQDPAKKETIAANEGATGKVTIDASEWNETQARIKALTEKSEREEISTQLKGYVFSDDGGKFTTAAVTPMTEFMQKLSPALRVEFEEKVLKNLPDRKVFGELGEENDLGTDSATDAIMAQVETYRKEHEGASFKEGLDAVKTKAPKLFADYQKESGRGPQS